MIVDDMKNENPIFVIKKRLMNVKEMEMNAFRQMSNLMICQRQSVVNKAFTVKRDMREKESKQSNTTRKTTRK
ncbi:hypothetical protein ACH3XW_31505 [Acanthocheilonema viteae]